MTVVQQPGFGNPRCSLSKPTGWGPTAIPIAAALSPPQTQGGGALRFKHHASPAWWRAAMSGRATWLVLPRCFRVPRTRMRSVLTHP